MGLRLQKSEQCQGCGINWWKNVTSPFRVSSREREYPLTLQSGCETEFLELCRVLFESWTGEVESLLMVFPLDLPRQKLVLPSARHSRRVLPGEPFLVLARAVFCHNWSAEAIPREKASVKEPFQTLTSAHSCAILLERWIWSLLLLNMMIWDYGAGFISLYKRTT